MGPSRSEGNGVLVEELNRQLSAAFTTPEGGSVNIRELHKLLSSLIDLHVRYDGEIRRSEDSTSTEAKKPRLENSTPQVPKSTQPEGAEDVQTAEEVLNTSRNSEQEPIQAPSKELSSFIEEEPVISTCPSVSDKMDVNEAQSSDGNLAELPSKPSSTTKTSSEQKHPDSVPGNEPSSGRPSSDLVVKSTTDSSFASDARIQSVTRADESAPVGGTMSSPSIGKATSPSLPSVENVTPLPFPDFVAILEGCRNHLEAIKEEVVELKARCQSQHEDTLNLAGALDSLVERVSAQEPKVAKLETDTHCLGMLVSDYELNFGRIDKHLERHDIRLREFEWAFQRVDKDRDAIRADLRAVTDQVNYLSTVKADKVDVQTEMNRRALLTDMQQRVPYDVFNETVRELTRTVTQLRENLHEVDQSLKTVQYELVKGLGSKASSQDVGQIRKQLIGVLSRWQKLEKEQQTTSIQGDFSSAAVSSAGVTALGAGAGKCLTCGIQTTLEGNSCAVPLPTKFLPSNNTRNVGGAHTKHCAAEKIFRTGSLGTVKKEPQEKKRSESCWKL